MRFLVAIVCSVLLIALLAKPLKRYPVPFYLAALALDFLYAYGVANHAFGGFWSFFMPLMQRCGLAFVLFSIVMFIGVLGESSKLRAALMPIRQQLSILACIFAGSHISYYAVSYLPRIADTFSLNVMASLVFSVALTLAMAVLLVTSFTFVKATLSANAWKRIQRLAYPFYLGIYIHLLLPLSPSALAGKETAMAGLAVYSLIIISYIALRLWKKQREDRPLADRDAVSQKSVPC